MFPLWPEFFVFSALSWIFPLFVLLELHFCYQSKGQHDQLDSSNDTQSAVAPNRRKIKTEVRLLVSIPNAVSRFSPFLLRSLDQNDTQLYNNRTRGPFLQNPKGFAISSKFAKTSDCFFSANRKVQTHWQTPQEIGRKSLLVFTRT